jgi:uncharacterized membrane protein
LKTYGIAYLATGLVFLLLDAIWLSLATNRLYRPLLGPMLIEGFNLTPAVLFYLIYVAGIVFFAVTPALSADRWGVALGSGALLGLLAYATYDLTNQATLRGWPMMITLVDMCWGTIATTTAATAGFLITRAVTRLL